MEKLDEEAVYDTESSHPVSVIYNKYKKRRTKSKKHKKTKATRISFSGILHDCKHCNRFFPSQNRLDEHVEQSHFHLVTSEKAETESFVTCAQSDTEIGYSCKRCTQCFPSQEELHQHVTDKICRGEKSRDDSVNLHRKARNKKSISENVPSEISDDCDLECTTCSVYFSSTTTLKKHQEMHTCEVVVNCPCCSIEVRTPNPNVRSIETQTHEFHSCDMCTDKFENTQDLHWHMLNRHKITPSPVQVIGPKRPGRPRHLQTPKQKKLTCKFCYKVFKTIQAATDHENTHSGNTPYNCTTCEMSFQQKSTLKDHRSNHHQTACSICGKLFINLARLEVHFKRHKSESKKGSKEKKWICHKCGQTYGRKAHLTMHMKRHEGIKSFSCEQCDKAFYTSHNLKEHIWTHTGEKPYPCTKEGCLKRFTQKSHLNYHIKSHARKAAQLQAYHEASQQRAEANAAKQSESHPGKTTQQLYGENISHVEEGVQEEEVNTTPHPADLQLHQHQKVQYVQLESQMQEGQDGKATEVESYPQPTSIFITEIHSYSEQVI